MIDRNGRMCDNCGHLSVKTAIDVDYNFGS